MEDKQLQVIENDTESLAPIAKAAEYVFRSDNNPVYEKDTTRGLAP